MKCTTDLILLTFFRAIKSKWRHLVAEFNPSQGVNFWVRCASGNVSFGGVFQTNLPFLQTNRLFYNMVSNCKLSNCPLPNCPWCQIVQGSIPIWLWMVGMQSRKYPHFQVCKINFFFPITWQNIFISKCGKNFQVHNVAKLPIL